uniref:CENP-V/GFA domain-containing protein n=1 Tax=Globisporangium ultimum (strain ATCC 200006 / CBS 805.95 / DAOM BR144) TaxID=431595 RepID=K3X1S3_GLOUD
MGGGMRELDRAIGAISTLVVGIGFLMIRELFREKNGQSKWEKYTCSEEGTDVYFQKKYGMPKMPLFQHRGGCDCGSLRFLILAPKRVEAFDDSNTFSCKKGRFPYLIVPTSCFEMIESAEVSLYESQASGCQHVFCSKCGIHIFQFDHTQPDCVAVNVYCIEDENFEELKIIFMPKGARPIFGRPKRVPLAVDQPLRRPLNQYSFNSIREEHEDSSISFQKQLLLWAKLDDQPAHIQASNDDTQSQSSSTSHSRFSFTSDEQVSVTHMKEQLEFYLKRHLEDDNNNDYRV